MHARPINVRFDDFEHTTLTADAEPEDLYPAGDGAFEFERTASRLIEMRTHDYLAAERQITEQT